MDKPDKPKNQKSHDERIAMGECVSPMTTDECPVCVDICKAAHFRIQIADALKNAKINGKS